MTYGAYTPRGFAAPPRGRSRKARARCLPWVLALIVGGTIGCVMRDAPDAPIPVAVSRSAPVKRVARIVPPKPARPVRAAGAVFDPSFTAPSLTAGYRPPPLGETAIPQARFEAPRPAATQVAILVPQRPAPDEQPQAVAEAETEAEAVIPLPPVRPAVLAAAENGASPRRVARLLPPPVQPAAAPDSRTVFDKIFGRAPPPSGTMAYAAPDDSGLGLLGAVRPHGPDRWTAVYDIAAHTVTLPDGRRLEAHSGLGPRKDDPASVTEHMRGATPPALYDLTPRESLFHGVAALRLTPIEGTTFGREGLLAHTYMLGPRGDSNGCVVFRDYRAFRAAYDSGLVRRLAVVARGG